MLASDKIALQTLPAQELGLIALIVAAAFTVEAALGFGATVVALALGSLVVPIDVILPAFVPVNLVLSSVLVARGVKHIAWRVLLRHVPWIALGLPIGIVFFTRFDERTLKLAFGAFVLVLSGLELYALRARGPREEPKPVPKGVAVVLLALGGMIHGAFATGGPMVVYVLGRELADDKAKFRSTLSTLWLTLNVVLFTTYVVGGKISGASLSTSGVMAVSLFVGLMLGELAFRRVAQERFRVLVFTMLAVAALVLFGKNL